MQCLRHFLSNSGKDPAVPFVKIVVAMFSEHIAKRSFPTLEFAPIQIKGGAGEMGEVANEVALEKAWLVYSNICKIGQEFTASKSKSKETVGDIIKKNPKIGELLPLPDDLKRLTQGGKLMTVEEFLKNHSENVDLVLEGDMIWPAEEGIVY